jgi:heat shock protein HslJ
MTTKITMPLAAVSLMLALAGCSLSGGTPVPSAPSAGGSATAAAATIPTGTWRLVSLRETGQAEVAVSHPELFTAELTADGQVNLRADCNRCHGTYTAGDRRLSVGAMACTRAFCVATAPLDTTFAGLVGGAQTWTASDDQHLDLASDAGVLRFQR